jgi:hypothetical protein
MIRKSGNAAQPSRDVNTLNIFLAVDDALQGFCALHTYISGAHRVTENMVLQTDQVLNLQITYEWVRPCKLSELLRHMKDAFEFMHCRSSLLAIVPAFEIALQRFRQRLWHLGLLGTQGRSYEASEYKTLLKWAFQLVKNTKSGSIGMRQRLPLVCGDVDNCRRLRNLILHNNNKYTKSYIDDVIEDGWLAPQFQRGHVASVKNREPIFLTEKDFFRFSCSHIELLHMLHNTLQRKYFKCKADYNYAAEGKATEWFRMVSGRYDAEV